MKPPPQVAHQILEELENIPPNDRVGFLYGMVLRLLQVQGLTRAQIEHELELGVEIAFAPNVLPPSVPAQGEKVS